jgi:hypothetical protein
MSRSVEEALRVLGVAAGSDPETVAQAYRRRARDYPPANPNPPVNPATPRCRLTPGPHRPALTTGSPARWRNSGDRRSHPRALEGRCPSWPDP